MRKLMWFSVGFGAASILGAYFYNSLLLWGALAALVIGVIFIIFCHKFKCLRICAVVMIAFASGIGWFEFYDAVYLQTARDLDGQTIETIMEVSDYSYTTDYGTAISANMTIEGRSYSVLVYLDGEGIISPGDKLQGTFRFRFTAQGGSKEPTYHRSEGIFLLAYQSGAAEHTKAQTVALHHYPAVWRRQIIQRIGQLFPSDAAGFAKALLLGDRSGIDYETNTAFKIGGISHIIAVSGLHVSILFSLVYLISGRNHILSCLLGIPILILFAAIVGFTPSITRACIMHSLMLLAMMINRDYDPPTALAFAVIVMLFVNPMVVISISLQLSVGCMIGIFLFCKRIHEWLKNRKHLGSAKGRGLASRLKRWFASSASISMSASVLTTPLVAYHFGAVSLISVLTNLLVLWIITFIFYGIVFSCAVSLVSLFVGRIAAWVIVLPIRLVIGTAKVLAQFPLAAVYTESDYVVIWIIGAYLLLAVFLSMRKKSVLTFACCMVLSLCASLLLSWTEPLLDDCRVTVLDVGQGQCILLQSEGRTFLVDCGGDRATASSDLAAETLLSQGISRLDGIIVTHYDSDHAGGVPYLLTRIDADVIFLPEIADEDGIGAEIKKRNKDNIIRVSSDLSLNYGQTSLTIFGPESYDSGNESCLCVLFQTEKYDILITGDRGHLGEMLLLHRAQLPELEVLIAGHHGSAGSTGEKLLEATSPEYVLISVGENNIYSHPAQSLLDRLKEKGCIVYRTDLNGTIIYRG